MFELKDNIIKKYDRSIPDVSFDNQEMLWNMVNIIDIDMNVYQYLGLLFLKLGFEPEDKLLLCNYDKSCDSFDCILNNSSIYRVRFNKNDNQILVKSDNVIYGYECEKIPYGEMGMRVSLGSYTYECDGGIKLTRYLSREKTKFVLSSCDYIFELEIVKPCDINLPLFDERGVYAKYRLDYEHELFKYMASLEIVNKSIIDIYNELCENYLGNICRYPELILRISEVEQNKVINLIHLKYGNLEKVLITNDKARVFLDKDDNSSVELLYQREYPFKFCMTYQDGIETYSFSPTGDMKIKNYTNYGIGSDIDSAYEELLDVKIKVKKMFNNGSM